MGTVDGRGIWINLTLISVTYGGPSTQDSKKEKQGENHENPDRWFEWDGWVSRDPPLDRSGQ
jgi:hypothetical protein